MVRAFHAFVHTHMQWLPHAENTTQRQTSQNEVLSSVELIKIPENLATDDPASSQRQQCNPSPDNAQRIFGHENC